MSRGPLAMPRVVLLPALCALICLTGCPKDPYEADTWIEQLDEHAEWDKARVQLERLRDPKAIEPLGRAWERYNKNPKILRTIVSLADQDKNGGPFWKDAVPILKRAVDEYDVLKLRSIDDAIVAAEALGKSKDASAVDVLIRAASNAKLPAASEGQRLRIAAVRALGEFGSSPRAVEALIKILEIQPFKVVNGKPVPVQPPQVNAAAANALAATGSKQALQPLMKALYGIPAIYRQVRGALVRLRKSAQPELVRVLKGEHKDINAYAKENDFANNCKAGEGPKTTCKAPGNLVFKAAAILGEMRSKEAAGVLAAQLSKAPQIAFFNGQTGEPGPPDHTAVLDALRKIGEPKTAAAVYAFMTADKTDDMVRPMAIDVYSFVSDGTTGMDWLAKQIKDDSQDDEEIRKAAALSYARMVYSDGQMEPIQWLISRYQKEADKLRKKAEATKDERTKAQLNRDAKGYDGFVLLFDQQRARAFVGVKCKKDAACYAGLLDKKTSEILTMLSVPKAKQDQLARGDRDAYRIAVFERALMEIGKLGDAAKGVLPSLLKLAGARERIIRQGALLALVRVAPESCADCVTALKKIVSDQAGQNTLAELNAETQLVLQYYLAE